MVLRRDRKGIISLVDAMFFVSILSVVSISMFSFCVTEYQEEPMAKTVCEDVISIELKASDVLETSDSDVYRISDLLASGMSSGNTERLERYIEGTLEDLVPGNCGYRLTITYGEKNMEFIRNENMPATSEYATEVDIVNGSTMAYRMEILSN